MMDGRRLPVVVDQVVKNDSLGQPWDVVRIRTDDMDYVENLIDLIDLQRTLDAALR